MSWISFCLANSADIHYVSLATFANKNTRRSKTPFYRVHWTILFESYRTILNLERYLLQLFVGIFEL